MKNIILTGMPGSGKSTTGVCLAENLEMPFTDTDRLIVEYTGMQLQDIIDKKGLGEFLKTEEKVVLELNLHNHVIATGGSVIYSKNAVGSLKENGVMVYLQLPLNEILLRVKNVHTRGIVMAPGQNLIDIYTERIVLYEKYADIIVNCAGKEIEQIISEIEVTLRRRTN